MLSFILNRAELERRKKKKINKTKESLKLREIFCWFTLTRKIKDAKKKDTPKLKERGKKKNYNVKRGGKQASCQKVSERY